MTDWPKVRVAHKDGEFHVLWPGELSTPFKRSGYEIQEYAPGKQSPAEPQEVWCPKCGTTLEGPPFQNQRTAPSTDSEVQG